MDHPSDNCEQAVIDAARTLLENLISAGEHRPEQDIVDTHGDQYPRDDDGDPWYSDCWALSQALDAYDSARANQ